MPRFSTFGSKKKSFFGKRYGSTAIGTMRGASDLPELKYFDVPTFTVPVAQTLNGQTLTPISVLNAIIQGPDMNQRIGRKIIMKSLQAKIRMYPTTQTANSTAVSYVNLPDYCKWAVIYDAQPDGLSVPLVSNFGSNPTGIYQVNPTEANSLAFHNIDTRSRYKTLMTDCKSTPAFLIEPIATQTTVASTLPVSEDGTVVTWERYERVDLPSIYASGAGVAPIETGALYFIALGMKPQPPTPNLTGMAFDVSIRIRFTDT